LEGNVKRSIVFFVLFFVAHSAFSASPVWVPVGGDEKVRAFVDVANVKPRNDLLSAWVMYEYIEPQRYAVGTNEKEYSSSLDLNAFDCSGGRYATMSKMLYPLPSGGGSALGKLNFASDRLEWSYAETPTLGAILLKLVCDLDKSNTNTSASNIER
jgi:hypothetical protein